MISLLHRGSEIYFPNGHFENKQLSRTTHLGIGAHPDDLEILAIHGILDAFDDPSHFFSGITVSNGKGAPRSGGYAEMSDDKYCKLRYQEQKKAADIGKYNAQVFLNYESREIKSTMSFDLIRDLNAVITTTAPSIIYTHNPADRHDTHVAVCLHVIQAIRELESLPEDIKLYGCEVWRGLDWLPEDHKITFDVSDHPDLQRELLSVNKSQMVENKDYARAVEGRRIANATFNDPYSAKHAQRIQFAMDLTPLIYHPEMMIDIFVGNSIKTFEKDVRDRLNHLRRTPGTFP